MRNYKYRDKVSGQWIAKAVCEGKILEFVTRGTLTPYDFVLICENNEDDPKEKKMIREVWSKEKAQEAKQKGKDSRAIAEDHWALLRKIRVQLNRYWEAQLDSLMSKITGTDQEPSFVELKSASMQNSQKQVNEDELLIYWRSAPSDVNKLEKEIKNRHYKNGFEVYSTEDCSFESLKDWMVSKNLDGDFGCYAFFNKKSDTENCNYVGMTARLGFKTRLKSHFDDPQKTWTENFDEIHFWKINQQGLNSSNTQTQNQSERRQIRCWLLEKLIIKKYQPKENRTRGNLSDPCDKIVDIIASEISGLCQDGELLDKQNQISKKAQILSEKDEKIHDLKEEIKRLSEEKLYGIDDEGDDLKEVCIPEDQIDEDDRELDDENK